MKDAKKLFLLFFITITTVKAQTSFEQNYYASNLNSFSFFNRDLASITQMPNSWNDQQLHFRWNGSFYYGSYFKTQMSIRNRLFTGYQWQENLNNFRGNLDKDWLECVSIDTEKTGIHHQIDRLYAQLEKGNWNFRIGRQRINWGIQNYWNSHDLFNQTNFFDFDYIERPGTDAIRVQHYSNSGNSIEIALNHDIQAALYKFNLKSYDFQILLAQYYQDFCLGFGWAGQIKNAGFKGEFNYFNASKSNERSLIGSIGLDYSFKDGTYISAGCLYNSQNKVFSPFEFYAMEISAKNPMPFEYNFLYQINYPIHPLIQFGTALIHDGNLDFIFVNPQISYSVSESLDLMVSSQNIWMNYANQLEAINQTLFTRLQYNF